MNTATRSSPDRRWAARFQPTLGTVYRIDTDAGQKTGLGLVWNLSETGVGMLIPERIEPGSAIKGELATTENGSTLSISVKVAHIRQLQTGDYFLGGQFVRPLAANEMRPFLASPQMKEAAG